MIFKLHNLFQSKFCWLFPIELGGKNPKVPKGLQKTLKSQCNIEKEQCGRNYITWLQNILQSCVTENFNVTTTKPGKPMEKHGRALSVFLCVCFARKKLYTYTYIFNIFYTLNLLYIIHKLYDIYIYTHIYNSVLNILLRWDVFSKFFCKLLFISWVRFVTGTDSCMNC